MYPGDRKYTGTHEWARPDKGANTATVGITSYAIEELKDIVFLELPAVGMGVSKGSPFGVIESVKAVFDLNSPVTGRVTEANESITGSLEVLQADPYGKGWMIKVELSSPGELEFLMDAAEYEASLGE